MDRPRRKEQRMLPFDHLTHRQVYIAEWEREMDRIQLERRARLAHVSPVTGETNGVWNGLLSAGRAFLSRQRTALSRFIPATWPQPIREEAECADHSS